MCRLRSGGAISTRLLSVYHGDEGSEICELMAMLHRDGPVGVDRTLRMMQCVPAMRS